MTNAGCSDAIGEPPQPDRMHSQHLANFFPLSLIAYAEGEALESCGGLASGPRD